MDTKHAASTVTIKKSIIQPQLSHSMVYTKKKIHRQFSYFMHYFIWNNT